MRSATYSDIKAAGKQQTLMACTPPHWGTALTSSLLSTLSSTLRICAKDPHTLTHTLVRRERDGKMGWCEIESDRETEGLCSLLNAYWVFDCKTAPCLSVRSDNCCDRILRCLSYVPCGSLVAWIILLLGLGGLAGGLVVGTQKARDLLRNDKL